MKTMYIVESPPVAEQRTLHFIGDQQERAVMGKLLAVSALGVLSLQETSFEEVAGLMTHLADRPIIETTPPELYHLTTRALSDDYSVSVSEGVGYLRARAQENAGAQELLQATQSTDHFMNIDDWYWITSDGYHARNEAGVVKPRRYGVKSMLGFCESEDTADNAQELDEGRRVRDFVRRVGVRAAAMFQYELVWDGSGRPIILSDRQHLQLGTVNKERQFIPDVTLLQNSHPVVSRSSI
jgi:hypothetical protein